jgi:hypothetical protein
MSTADQSQRTAAHIVRDWFDRLEIVLHHEAELAGLLEHGSTVGSGREFLTKRVLRSFLPPTVHYGSGIIIDREGSKSKQIDIVLYDSRFPLLEIQEGMGLYFVEGVIATIEVKSKLTQAKLQDALDNCASVSMLDPTFRSFDQMNRMAHYFINEKKFSVLDAKEAVRYAIAPRTYIFAFTTDMGDRAICNVVCDWYGARGESKSAENPGLPVVIATKGTIGLVHDRWMQLDPGPAGEDARRDLGSHVRAVMGFWPTDRQFGWFALRLMHDVSERLALVHSVGNVPFSIDGYMPAHLYFEEDQLYEKTGRFIFWTKQEQPPQEPEQVQPLE